MIHWLLQVLCYIWNPKGYRKRNGRVITDIHRLTHSLLLKRKIKKGTIKLPPKVKGTGRKYKVRKDGKVTLCQTK